MFTKILTNNIKNNKNSKKEDQTDSKTTNLIKNAVLIQGICLDYDQSKLLGSGGFGKVYKAFDQNNNKATNQNSSKSSPKSGLSSRSSLDLTQTSNRKINIKINHTKKQHISPIDRALNDRLNQTINPGGLQIGRAHV